MHNPLPTAQSPASPALGLNGLSWSRVAISLILTLALLLALGVLPHPW
jgi:hypothetical protein